MTPASAATAPAHAYCLFCETQQCRLIAALIERQYGCRAIAPEIIQRKWVRGVPTEARHDWLPGYVFVYTDEPSLPGFDLRGIIRRLGEGELTGKDRAFADMILAQGGVMGTLRVVRVGDRCRVADPLWKDMDGVITRMDRNRRRCCVTFTFDGLVRNVWLGCELVTAQP